MKLNEEQEKQRLGLYRAGFSDKEMAKLLSRSKPAICGWRTRRNLPPNEIKKQCTDCGSKFSTFRPIQFRCQNCKQVIKDIFLNVRIVRAQFSQMAVSNPKKAREFADQMARQEGEEFKDLLIDGILDKPEEELKRRVTLQHHKQMKRDRRAKRNKR